MQRPSSYVFATWECESGLGKRRKNCERPNRKPGEKPETDERPEDVEKNRVPWKKEKEKEGS